MRFGFLFLVACGGGGGDSTPVDGAPDDSAPDVDAQRGTLTVTTFERIVPVQDVVLAGVPIVSLRGNGDVIAEATTDGAGKATLEVETGGSVLAIYRHNGGAKIVMYTDIRPGDALELGALPTAPFEGAKLMTASFPDFPDANRYEVNTPCGLYLDFASPVTINCGASSMDLLYVASRDFQPLAWALQQDVPLVPNGATAITEWSPATTATFSITNASGRAAMELEGDYGTGTIFTARLESPGTGLGCEPVNGACSGTSPWVGAPSRLWGTAIVDQTELFTEVVSSATSPTFALDVPVLPPRAIPSSDTGSAITWTLDSGAPFDTIRTRFEWTLENFSVFEWVIYGPPTSNGAALPVLPSAYSDVLPRPTDVVKARPKVIDVKEVEGYDQLRAFSERPIECLQCGLRAGRITGAISR